MSRCQCSVWGCLNRKVRCPEDIQGEEKWKECDTRLATVEGDFPQLQEEFLQTKAHGKLVHAAGETAKLSHEHGSGFHLLHNNN